MITIGSGLDNIPVTGFKLWYKHIIGYFFHLIGLCRIEMVKNVFMEKNKLFTGKLNLDNEVLGQESKYYVQQRRGV